MNENMKAFLQKASEDDALKAGLAEISNSVMSDAREKLIKLAKENGCSFTEEDMNTLFVGTAHLSEDELNTVAGGGYTLKTKDGKLYSNCSCTVAGHGTGDDFQKECYCVFGGCGELTKKGKEKAAGNEIHWTGHKGAKVAMFCALDGEAWTK